MGYPDRCLLITERHSRYGIGITHCADPVGAEAFGECLIELFTCFGGEGMPGHPESGSIDVDFDSDVGGCSCFNGDAFLVVSGHKVGIGGNSGFYRDVFPGAAESGRLSEFPEVVNDTGPDRCFSIRAAEEVFTFAIGINPREEEESVWT